MKKMQDISIKKNLRQKLLASLVAAASTSLIATSVSQASDIDIYQEAKSGNITLMMLFDISGSMGFPQTTGDKDACDIPAGTSVDKSYSENTTRGGYTYRRDYCTVKHDAYFYKRTGSSGNYQYFKCGANGSTSSGSCTISISELPAGVEDEMDTSTTGSTLFYYKKKSTAKYYDRITRLKDAMFDLLNGNTAKGVQKIGDDKIIGLSAYSFNGTGGNGYILVPAQSLGTEVILGGVKRTQRDILLEAVANKLYARGGTPTGNGYAEAAAYLMGTKTFDNNDTYSFSNNVAEIPVFFEYKQGSTTKYVQCNAWNTNGTCSDWASNNNSTSRDYDFLPLDLSMFSKKTCSNQQVTDGKKSGDCYFYNASKPVLPPVSISSQNRPHGFNYSLGKTADGSRYEQPSSLSQLDENKKCSGQGIYVLTDGAPSIQHNQVKAMRNALGTTKTTFTCTEQAGDGSNSTVATSCSIELAKRLKSKDNKLDLEIKTAVVGFGGQFGGIASFDRNLTPEENIAKIRASTGEAAQKSAAEWGVLGGGGWYSGNDSQDVVDSVNNFINDLSTDIPSVTTGSPIIPKDALNPSVLQNDAYYQQFEPTPEKSYRLWLGNLKKYLVSAGGILKGKDGKKIVDEDGKILDNYDYWAYPVDEAKKDGDGDIPGSIKFALHGGVWSRLALRTEPVNNPTNGAVQRKVLTNRIYLGGAGASSFGESSNNTLRQVQPTDLNNSNYKNDPNRGYLVRLLGYNIDVVNPPSSADELKTSPEFRQIGAVMHSSPLLITNKGKVGFDSTTKTLTSTGREDYILFGSTQGLLHVVKAGKTGVASGGEEVFAFVPNEMVDKQKQAFEKPEATSGGTNNLFYGIDGPWTAYTEYVIDGSGYLTVGTGKGSQRGVQDVYGGLRMGGKSYYALDLRDINDPKLKFHINPDAATTGPLSYMGESWSKPSIGFVNWDGKRTRVMFVGGGYDRIGGEDNQGYENPAYVQTNKVGAGVYMFRAEDEASPGTGTGKAGELLWWSSANATDKTTVPVAKKHDDMKYSVVSEIRTVDRDGDDLIDHIYFGDLGGQIFRVDFDNKQNTIANFAKQPVRIFNGYKSGGKSPRFYDMPAFSLYNDKGTIFAVITQGSGNRSKPLFSDSTYDYDAVYNIYDKDVARKDLYSATAWTTKDIKPDNSTGLFLLTEDDRKNDSTLKAAASSKGWYYEFKKCLADYGDCKDYEQQTEKVFGTPVVLNNKMFVSTFDASKDGLAGDCGAGVKGASLMTTFCMPFGQCKASDVTGTTHSMIGAGIHTIAVGNDVSDGGGGNNGNNNGGGSGNNSEDNKSSASNYCISTGSRMTITVTGGASTGEQTRMCLIPQRWYEKLIKD